MKHLITEKTIDAFFMLVGEFLGNESRDLCAFFDYEDARSAYKKWANHIDAFNVATAAEFSATCTPSFWNSYKKYLHNMQRRVPADSTGKNVIVVTVKAQRALAEYCKKHNCDHSSAIVAAFSADVAAPILSESDTRLADEVVRALYEKIGKRLVKIEETMCIINIDKDVF